MRIPSGGFRRPGSGLRSWFAIAIPYVAVIVMMMAPRDDLAVKFSDFRFLLEQIAALCTAIGAAVAAFQSIVPGYNRRFLLLPLVPLTVWLASLGQGCVAAVDARRRFTELHLGFRLHSGDCAGGNAAGRGDGAHAAKGSASLATCFGRARRPGGGRIGQFRSSSLPQSGRELDGAGLADGDRLHADYSLRMGRPAVPGLASGDREGSPQSGGALNGARLRGQMRPLPRRASNMDCPRPSPRTAISPPASRHASGCE